MSIKTFKLFESNLGSPVKRLSVEESCLTSVDDLDIDEIILEQVRFGKIPLASDIILSPYLAPAANLFPNDKEEDLSSYTSRSLYFVGDKNILIIMFAGKMRSGYTREAEKYIITPVLFYENNHNSFFSISSPILLDFTIEEDDYGFCLWKRDSDLFISIVATRIIGSAKYIKILCRMNPGYYLVADEPGYYNQFDYFPNLEIGKIYIGAI